MNRAWSDDEIHLLKKIYSNSTVTGLMRNINRTYTAIYKKAYNLKLKRNPLIEFAIRSDNRKGEKCCSWKGGRMVSRFGYVLILTGNKYKMEHRIVMEEHIGRESSSESSGVKSSSSIGD